MTADVAPACEIQSAAKIFISYSRKDMAFADRIEAALKARGFEVLIDRDEIYAFEDWWKRLQVLIGGADTIVFMLSPDSVASHEVLREVEYAASLHKRFAPIVCRRVDDDTVPEALRRLNFIFLDVPAGFDLGVDRLAVALQTDIDWIRQHTQYGELARHWLAKDRPAASCCVRPRWRRLSAGSSLALMAPPRSRQTRSHSLQRVEKGPTGAVGASKRRRPSSLCWRSPAWQHGGIKLGCGCMSTS